MTADVQDDNLKNTDRKRWRENWLIGYRGARQRAGDAGTPLSHYLLSNDLITIDLP
jgi:hypothetical protein